MSNIEIVTLEVCTSTQAEARQRVAAARDGATIAVRAVSQTAGRGRDGRTWQDPPGTSLLLSIGRAGPLPVSVLDELPLRITEALLDSLELLAPGARKALVWKAPNDLLARASGAKVGGILVDARTQGDSVQALVIGIGVNLAGAAFTTSDNRAATSVQELLGAEVPAERLAVLVMERVERLLA